MAEWLRTVQPDLKILFTSGYTEEAILDQAGFEKGIDFLPKPYTPAALIRKVREMLDAK
jgi:CheY-like chemotaxis protein